MQVIRDDLWFCDDCLIVAVNGDYSGVDTFYPPGQTREEHQAAVDKRIAAIDAGLEALGPHVVPDYDSETEEGIRDFSSRNCDCCGTHLAGTRHRFAILGE